MSNFFVFVTILKFYLVTGLKFYIDTLIQLFQAH